jgi:hypothetical protein
MEGKHLARRQADDALGRVVHTPHRVRDGVRRLKRQQPNRRAPRRLNHIPNIRVCIRAVTVLWFVVVASAILKSKAR